MERKKIMRIHKNGPKETRKLKRKCYVTASYKVGKNTNEAKRGSATRCAEGCAAESVSLPIFSREMLSVLSGYRCERSFSFSFFLFFFFVLSVSLSVVSFFLCVCFYHYIYLFLFLLISYIVLQCTYFDIKAHCN